MYNITYTSCYHKIQILGRIMNLENLSHSAQVQSIVQDRIPGRVLVMVLVWVRDLVQVGVLVLVQVNSQGRVRFLVQA